MISFTVIVPDPSASPAGHADNGKVPKSMLTMVISSSTVTLPFASQSPVQAGGIVAVGAGVSVGVGLLRAVEVGVLLEVCVGVSVGVALGGRVGDAVGVDVLSSVDVGVALGEFIGVSVGVLLGVFVGVSVATWMVTEPPVRFVVTGVTQSEAKNCVSSLPALNSKVSMLVPALVAVKFRVDTRTLSPSTALAAPTFKEMIPG
jgi:hypothetical protein